MTPRIDRHGPADARGHLLRNANRTMIQGCHFSSPMPTRTKGFVIAWSHSPDKRARSPPSQWPPERLRARPWRTNSETKKVYLLMAVGVVQLREGDAKSRLVGTNPCQGFVSQAGPPRRAIRTVSLVGFSGMSAYDRVSSPALPPLSARRRERPCGGGAVFAGRAHDRKQETRW